LVSEVAVGDINGGSAGVVALGSVLGREVVLGCGKDGGGRTDKRSGHESASVVNESSGHSTTKEWDTGCGWLSIKGGDGILAGSKFFGGEESGVEVVWDGLSVAVLIEWWRGEIGKGGGGEQAVDCRDGPGASGYPLTFSAKSDIRIRWRWRVSARISADIRPLNDP
jgi:hypothetical protein